MQKVGRRRRLMRYLKREDPVRYRQLIESLGIRG
jgi:ribosomal protein S15